MLNNRKRLIDSFKIEKTKTLIKKHKSQCFRAIKFSFYNEKEIFNFEEAPFMEKGK